MIERTRGCDDRADSGRHSANFLAAIIVLVAACDNPYSRVGPISADPSYQDAALLEKAWRQPAAAAVPNHQLEYQEHLTFCGPATAVNALRSLGVEVGGEGALLDQTSVGYWHVRFGGMTLDQLATVIREKSKRPVEVIRDIDLATFKQLMIDANRADRRYLINFHRGPLFGHGGGHHSPIGGYLPDEDLVLVLDVNGSYKPWLVKPERLYEAMNTIDSSTGKKRGLIRIQ